MKKRMDEKFLSHTTRWKQPYLFLDLLKAFLAFLAANSSLDRNASGHLSSSLSELNRGRSSPELYNSSAIRTLSQMSFELPSMAHWHVNKKHTWTFMQNVSFTVCWKWMTTERNGNAKTRLWQHSADSNGSRNSGLGLMSQTLSFRKTTQHFTVLLREHS